LQQHATTGPLDAPEIDLSDILYIHMAPYIPSAWLTALSSENLLASFYNLVHDITYSIPIGSPPPLSDCFLPPNLASENVLPELIDKELLAEVSAHCMSGPFTIEQASVICGGPILSSPVSLVKKTPGDGVWRMI